MEWDEWGNGVKNMINYIIHLICYCIGNPSPIGFFWIQPCCIQIHKAMLIGMGVASTNRTDKFLAQVLLRSIAPRSFMVEGIRVYARVWRSYLQAVLIECYFCFRQCGDVINYVIPHYLYSDIIVVWMWYSTVIWVIRSIVVLLHFDSVDFPSWKLRSF
jgi:hypothetical protein